MLRISVLIALAAVGGLACWTTIRDLAGFDSRSARSAGEHPAVTGPATTGPGASDSGVTGAATGSADRVVAEAPRPAATAKPTPPRTPPEPLFAGWNQPGAVLVLSGEQHGYIEPCGCSVEQLGGLGRRDDLVRQIGARGWPVAGLDLGGLTNRPNRRQGKIKFGIMHEALKLMQYRGLALGVEELLLSYDLLTFHEAEKLPFLSANLVLFGGADPKTPVPRTIITVGNLKIGVTACFGPSYKGEVVPEGAAGADIEIGDPVATVKQAVQEMTTAGVDLVVLLSHSRLEETRKVLAAVPGIHLAVSAGGPEDPAPRPEKVGTTMLVTVGIKGKHVGVVGVFPGAQPALRFLLLDLDGKQFQETKRMRGLMELYQERLQSERLASVEPAIPHPTGAEFVGAETCGTCHKQAFAKWKTTKHSHAYDSLQTGRPEQAEHWISRVHDPECLACHVVGWQPKNAIRYQSGFADLQTGKHLLGNQCENCHGPGSEHIAQEKRLGKNTRPTDDVLKWRKTMHVDVSVAEQRLCVQCHDGDNDPNFKFEKYWPEVRHPWRD